MILLGVVIKAYTIMTFLTIVDEAWNMTHPRPFPKVKYMTVNWEVRDFDLFEDGSYILKKVGKKDDINKAEARRLWHERQANKTR
jgi:hypothetical protein